LRSDPAAIDRLADVLELPVKVIHQVRNPYDNIATMYRRAGGASLSAVVDRYIAMSEVVEEYVRTHADDVLTVRHEDLVSAPDRTLRRLFGFLDLAPSDDLLAACGTRVFASPRRTRDEVDWPPAQIARIGTRIAESALMRGYEREPR
jgi:hypothetical protein